MCKPVNMSRLILFSPLLKWIRLTKCQLAKIRAIGPDRITHGLSELNPDNPCGPHAFFFVYLFFIFFQFPPFPVKIPTLDTHPQSLSAHTHDQSLRLKSQPHSPTLTADGRRRTAEGSRRPAEAERISECDHWITPSDRQTQIGSGHSPSPASVLTQTPTVMADASQTDRGSRVRPADADAHGFGESESSRSQQLNLQLRSVDCGKM